MADFMQVMKDWRRMCESHRGCSECPLENEEDTFCLAGYDYDDEADYTIMEKKVVQWAADHPEPVYPTWGEWFVSRGMLPEKWDNLTSAYMDVGCVPNLIHSPIPAEIAQKLGIEPKEG